MLSSDRRNCMNSQLALAPPPPCLCSYGAVVQAQVFSAPGYNNEFKFGFVEMSCTAEAECALDAMQASPGAAATLRR